MKLVRKGTFETNSSSTHAIVIPKKVKDDNYSLYDSLDHDYGFGRQECRLCNDWDEKLAYVYMILKTNYDWSQNDNGWKPKHITTFEEIENFKIKVMAIWDVIESKEMTTYKSEPTPKDIFSYIDKDNDYNNYVDHAFNSQSRQ